MISWIGNLFGMIAQSPKEAAEVAEAGYKTIEERMASVKAALEKGGYKKLDTETLTKLREDIEKILDFVETALNILDNAKKEIGVDISLKRLRNVKARVQTVLHKRILELGDAA
jgi:hypothetical protein